MDALCSSVVAVDAADVDGNVAVVVAVLLGTSETTRDVRLTLSRGPSLFYAALPTLNVARLIARILVARAADGHAVFGVDADSINDLLQTFAHRLFHDDEIGFANSCQFQRLIYNVFASVVAHYENNKQWDQTANAVDLLIELVHGVRAMLPLVAWTRAWTDLQVLMHLVESTRGSVVFVGSRSTHADGFSMVTERLVERVLAERDLASTTSVADLNCAFGWCACSVGWRDAISACAASPLLQDHLSATATFESAVEHAFHAPIPSPTLTPAPSPSRPVSTLPLSPPCGSGTKRALCGGPSGVSLLRRHCAEGSGVGPRRLDFEEDPF